MPKFTTDGVNFFEFSQELLDKFPHSLLSVTHKWHGCGVPIGFSSLEDKDLEKILEIYQTASSKEEFDKLIKKYEHKAVSQAF